MTPTTFKIETKTNEDFPIIETWLIFENILKVNVQEFCKGKGFDALLSLPNVSIKMIVEVHSYIFFESLCASRDAENFNNEYDRCKKILDSRTNPQSNVSKITDEKTQ
jgi:hypothetical protein